LKLAKTRVQEALSKWLFYGVSITHGNLQQKYNIFILVSGQNGAINYLCLWVLELKLVPATTRILGVSAFLLQALGHSCVVVIHLVMKGFTLVFQKELHKELSG